MSLDDEWLAKLKDTMALDVSRARENRLSAAATIDMLLDIPEVAQAFHLRANRRQPLPPDPSTKDKRREVVDALNRVADWLEARGINDPCDHLRVIAMDLHPDRS